jgi:hypothetical protein
MNATLRLRRSRLATTTERFIRLALGQRSQGGMKVEDINPFLAVLDFDKFFPDFITFRLHKPVYRSTLRFYAQIALPRAERSTHDDRRHGILAAKFQKMDSPVAGSFSEYGLFSQTLHYEALGQAI